jgi:hypothetical protein
VIIKILHPYRKAPTRLCVINEYVTMLSYDTNRIENDALNNSSIVACIPCRRNVFNEPLPSTEWRDANTDTYADLKGL